MLDVNDLVEGVTKVRILEVPQFVSQAVGDVGVFIEVCEIVDWPLVVKFGEKDWFFRPKHLEIIGSEDNLVKSTSQSEDLIIYKSRWDEIVESLEGGYGMTDEEAEIVKSVLKNNTPFNIVNDPVIVDPIIEKEEQTHLDATHIRGSSTTLYYKSKLLKKWFWWSEDYNWVECNFDYQDYNWVECNFDYQDGQDLFPITISK